MSEGLAEFMLLSNMAACTTDASGFSLSRQNGVFVFLSCKSQCFCTYSSRLPVFKRARCRQNHIVRVKTPRTPKSCGTSVCSGGTKRHLCTEDYTSSRRPGDVAVPRQREEIPQQDQCTQSSGSWQHSWACTERLCSGTHWCLHRHFQHLTKSGCCPHMLQSYHHHSSPEEVISILLQWLPSSSTHSYSHAVLWTA